MDKTAVAHWAPEIGGQFWWNGVFFCFNFCSIHAVYW